MARSAPVLPADVVTRNCRGRARWRRTEHQQVQRGKVFVGPAAFRSWLLNSCIQLTQMVSRTTVPYHHPQNSPGDRLRIRGPIHPDCFRNRSGRHRHHPAVNPERSRIALAFGVQRDLAIANRRLHLRLFPCGSRHLVSTRSCNTPQRSRAPFTRCAE